jgi:hypothetical protein
VSPVSLIFSLALLAVQCSAISRRVYFTLPHKKLTQQNLQGEIALLQNFIDP